MERIVCERCRRFSLSQTGKRFKLAILGWGLIALGSPLQGARSAPVDNEFQQPAPGEQAPGAGSQEAEKGFKLKPPGKRRAIQGVASLVGLSKVTFPSQPGIQQDLEFTYVFPDRARWRMSPSAKPSTNGKEGKNKSGRGQRAQQRAAEKRKQRHQMFRYGNGAWTILPGSQSSQQHEGEELRIHMLRFEMRRLALIWPGELEWASEEGVQRAVLEDIGTIEVQLGDTQLPILVRSMDPDGTLREEFKNIQWKPPTKESERREPASWDLHFQGNHVWTEAFASMKWGGRLTESFFKPSDRFKGGGMRANGNLDASRIEIPEVAVWRVDINPEGKKDWDAAVQQAREAMEHWRPQLTEGGFVLDEYPVFRLDENALPLRLELRLKNLPDYPPKGWFAQGGVEGLRRMGVGLELANSSAVLNLRRRAPSGYAAMDAYLAVQLIEGSGIGIAQLVVPISRVR